MILTVFQFGFRFLGLTSVLPLSRSELSDLIFRNFKYGSLLSQKSKKESVFSSFRAFHFINTKPKLWKKYSCFLHRSPFEWSTCRVSSWSSCWSDRAGESAPLNPQWPQGWLWLIRWNRRSFRRPHRTPETWVLVWSQRHSQVQMT